MPTIELNVDLMEEIASMFKVHKNFLSTKFLPYFFIAENCVVPDKFNDGFCDDLNNLALCGYDGDDCCNSQDSEFCEVCMCYKSNFQISRFFGASKVHFFMLLLFSFFWIQIFLN